MANVVLLLAGSLAACGGGGSPADFAVATGVSAYNGIGWFVDSATGNDTAAGSPTAPWKTLARAAQQTLASGDAILLKCGSIWRETFTLSATNAPTGGATLGAWGSCNADNRPLISGSDPLTGLSWNLATGFASKPVYVANWAEPVTGLYWKGTPLVRARYPNRGGIGQEFRVIAAVTSNTIFTIQASDSAVLGSVSLAGANAMIRTNPWLLESHEIAGSTTGNVTLKAKATYPIAAGQGYFIEGHRALLDVAGEWHYDPVAKQLYVWLPDGRAPEAGTLETASRPDGILVSGVADSRIDRIAVERQTQRAITLLDAQRTAVTAVAVRDAGVTGILLDGGSVPKSSGSSIERSTVYGSGTTGISASGPGLRIIGNLVEATGIGSSGAGVSAGVLLDSVGGGVQDNRIATSAFAGIILSHPSGVSVSGNTIVQACLRFTDCGAIYAGGAPSAAQRSQIRSNLITDMVANLEGAVGGAPALVAGIYLDEQSEAVDVTSNMIERVGVGINLHNSANHSVRFNQVWLARQSSLRVHNSGSAETVRGITIEDNQFYGSSHLEAVASPAGAPTRRVVYAQEWVHAVNADQFFGGNSPNVSRRNITGTMSAPAELRWSLVDGGSQRSIDATAWSAFAAGEGAQAAYAAKPFIVTAQEPSLIQNVALNGASAGWAFWSPTPAAGGSISYNTCAPSSCADFRSGTDTDFLMSNTFQMSSASASNLYALRLHGQGVAAGATLSMAISRNGGNGGQLGMVMNQAMPSSSETRVDVLFNATSSDVARLNMSGSAGKSVRLRDVSLVRVTAYELLNSERESVLLANPGSTESRVDCPTTQLRTCEVSDLAGQPVSWPVTLAPGSSKVVVSADAKWKP